MIFNSFHFLIIFPLLFLLYYLIPARWQKGRNLYLLGVSYALYMSWKPAYALVLLGITLITFLGGLALEGCEDGKKKRILAWCFSFLGLMPLGVFKYYNFINETLGECFASIGLSFSLLGLNWAIPIGISFISFQAVGYLLDVYHKRIASEKDFLVYALFVSFFPSVVAGPINKASLVLPQLKSMRPRFDYQKAVAGLKMLLWGMFLKVVVADRVALYVDTVFPNYINYTGVTCFVASLLYSVQIYADFAGYSLMAIGVGKTMGIELTENFRRPYLAVSITDFWRRWHISLSTWLKDYIYIPLGGSRCSKFRNYWNILVTFLVSGIWHGANWTFIVWGGCHGALQVIEKAIGQQNCKYGWLGRGVKIVVTFLLVNFAWIFFRMPSLNDAVGIIKRIFDLSLPKTIFISGFTDLALIVSGVLLLSLNDLSEEFFPGRIPVFNNRHSVLRWGAYTLIFITILLTGVFGADQFIYANF